MVAAALSALQVGALLALLVVAATAFEWPVNAALGFLLGGLAVATAVGWWRRRTDRDGEHLGTADDIAYDPVADPGQAARERARVGRRGSDREEK